MRITIKHLLTGLFLIFAFAFLYCHLGFASQHNFFIAQNFTQVEDGGEAGFSPDDLTGLSLWLDATDASTMLESDDTEPENGDNVKQIDDQSGNNYDFIQGTASKQPVYTTGGQNSKSYLAFDGSADYIGKSSFNPWDQDNNYIWVVWEYTSASGTWFQWDNEVDPEIRAYANNSYIDFKYGDYTIENDDQRANTVGIFRFQYTDSDTRQAIYFNGALDKQSTSNDISIVTDNINMGIGATQDGYSPSAINLYEFIVVQGTLTGTEISDMEDYLSPKYNIALP